DAKSAAARGCMAVSALGRSEACGRYIGQLGCSPFSEFRFDERAMDDHPIPFGQLRKHPFIVDRYIRSRCIRSHGSFANAEQGSQRLLLPREGAARREQGHASPLSFCQQAKLAFVQPFDARNDYHSGGAARKLLQTLLLYDVEEQMTFL